MTDYSNGVTCVNKITHISYPFIAPKLKEHLLCLSEEDKYRRFYIPVREDTIDRYLHSINLTDHKNAIFVVYDNSGSTVVGMCHVAVSEINGVLDAELALTVSDTHRRRNVGHNMLQRAILHCKTLGIKRIYMYCLATNAPMQHMAQKLNMSVVTEFDESTGTLTLAGHHATHDTICALTSDHIALYDLSCRQVINAVNFALQTCVRALSLTPGE